jgi:hypothetical protein
MFSGFFIFPNDFEKFGIIVFILLLGAMLAGLSFKANRIEWDEVIVETRGGMLMSYSVDKEMGKLEVENIEKEKRAITSKF